MLLKIISGMAFFLLCLPAETFAQKMIIDFKSIADQTEPLATIQKLTFDSDDMIIDFKNGTTTEVEIATIQKLYFGDVSANNNISTKQLKVYPNPSSNEIKIDGLTDSQYSMNIYSINGDKVINKIISANASNIDVSALPPGMYFIVTNGFNAKFVKL